MSDSYKSKGRVICPVPGCGAIVSGRGRYGHLSKMHPELDYEEYRDKFQDAGEAEGEPVGPTGTGRRRKTEEDLGDPRALVAQFGREGLNKIKKKRLFSILTIAPGVGDKVIPFIMHKWEVNSRVKDDPMALYNMLHVEAGLKPNVAQSITQDVFSIEEEFADLLYQKGESPVFFRRPFAEQGAQPFGSWPSGYPPQMGSGPPYGWQSQTWPGQPWQGPSAAAPFLTKEEYYRTQREDEEKSRLSKMETQVSKLREDIPKIIKESMPAPRDDVGMIVEEVPIDIDGQPCPPDNAVSVKTVRRPFGGGGDEGMRALRKEISDVKELMQKRDLDVLRGEIKRLEDKIGERGKAGESEEFKGLKDQLNAAQKSIEDLRGQLTETEMKHLEDTITDLKARFDSMPQGEWRSDDMRLLATALNQATSTLRERKPGEKALEFAERALLPELSPPPGGTAPVEGADIDPSRLKRLRERGLVTTLLRR